MTSRLTISRYLKWRIQRNNNSRFHYSRYLGEARRLSVALSSFTSTTPGIPGLKRRILNFSTKNKHPSSYVFAKDLLQRKHPHKPITSRNPFESVDTQSVAGWYDKNLFPQPHLQSEKTMNENQLQTSGVLAGDIFDHYLRANVQIGLADIFEIKALQQRQNVETRFITAQLGLADGFDYRGMIAELNTVLPDASVDTHVTRSKEDVCIYTYFYDRGNTTNLLAIGLINISADTTRATLVSTQAHGDAIEKLLEEHIHDDHHAVFFLSLTQEGIRSNRRSIRRSTAKVAKKEFYPFLGDEPINYFDRFLNSSSGILLMIGPPGTGKSTFLRSLILHSGKDASMVFDEATMRSPDMLSTFYGSTHRILALEDADNFLTPRESGNADLAGLLNYADGVVADPTKKIVISTNLSSVNKVDPAILRKGRCYDIIQFQELTPEQASLAREAADLEPVTFEKSLVLAEALDDNQRVLTEKRSRMIGFTS